MKNKLLIMLITAILFTTSIGIESYATEVDNTEVDSNQDNDDYEVIDPYRGIPIIDGQTSVGVQVTETLPSSLSFEVPLYITAAVVDGQTEVIVPDNYWIKNTTINSNSKEVDIAVTQVTLTSHSTKDYWSITPDTPILENEIQINIAGISLREPTKEGVLMDLRKSVFYDDSTEKFVPIPYGEMIKLKIEANVLDTFRLNDIESTVAAAQFRINYTVSLLDTSGEPIGVGAFYEGSTPWD